MRKVEQPVQALQKN